MFDRLDCTAGFDLITLGLHLCTEPINVLLVGFGAVGVICGFNIVMNILP